MIVDMKTVMRFDVWYHPVMAQPLAEAPGVALHTVARSADPRLILDTLQASHVYQVPSARDELPPWHVGAKLLASLPRLLCVSTNGAGYGTVEVDACTRAGVLVANQSGANAQSVAEATLGLMFNCARQIEAHSEGFFL
ncbi:hypothetical protein OH710_24520 [Pseudomonas capsici]|uniref:hypothetical protein n=1 Tax=Pseudomonas capsici TaxID=2810614 RepID=UPI000EFFD20F|nr:hypothetical protein [Pseudomonas capsici]MCV4275812.1 hypothetical protein [Pseudomonas capsici]RMO09404.1 Glyoxylate reductase [Pseudomonas cichorii]